jgi:hypothetical protein
MGLHHSQRNWSRVQRDIFAGLRYLAPRNLFAADPARPIARDGAGFEASPEFDGDAAHLLLHLSGIFKLNNAAAAFQTIE